VLSALTLTPPAQCGHRDGFEADGSCPAVLGSGLDDVVPDGCAAAPNGEATGVEVDIGPTQSE